MTFEVKLLITFVVGRPLVILTKFGQNPIKHVEEEANCDHGLLVCPGLLALLVC